MSRVTDIFLHVRDTLNDHDKQRWSDETLLRALNRGQQDIAIQSQLFKNFATISLFNGQEIYALPDTVLRVEHATFNWRNLPLVSSGWMDRNRECDWRFTSSETGITHVVYDEVKRRQLRVYPRPFGDFIAEYIFQDSPYGVMVDLTDYTFDSPYGVSVYMADPDINYETQQLLYGVIAYIAVTDAFVVYYTECPPDVADVTEDPTLDKCFDIALQHYVCAIVLRNDLDTQNRAMGSEELIFYQRTLDEIMALSDSDSVSAPAFESHYNPMG